MDSYRQAVSVLPEPLRTRALEVDTPCMARTEEIRLRVGRVPTLVLPEGECPIPGTGQVSAQELERLVEFASQWSLHAVLEQLRRGYLTLEGGHRLGLCGSAVMEGEQIHALRDISGADLRVARQISGIARGFAGKLFQASKLCDTLILAPPGAGKTTLLRLLLGLVEPNGGSAALVGAGGTRYPISAGTRSAKGGTKSLQPMHIAQQEQQKIHHRQNDVNDIQNAGGLAHPGN